MEGETREGSWERYAEMGRAQLRRRAGGKTAGALGRPAPGETQEEIDRVAQDDRRKARRGLVRLVRGDGSEYFLHVDGLTRGNRPDRTRAEKAQVAWLKGRLEKHRGEA